MLLLVAGGLVFQPPNSLRADLDYGRLFIPFVDGGGRWLTPVGAATVVLALLLVARTLTARRPLVDLRAWGRSLREADVTGAAYLAVALGGVILAFATADPKVQVFSDQGLWYLLGAGVASVAFVVHLRRASDPLLPRGALAARPAWGSVVVSFFIGAALIAALIDVPLFARTTTYQDSQLLAALVLVRFLVALPVGAVVGGYLTRTVPAGVVTAVGMAMAAVAFVMMSRWDVTALESWTATVPLVVGGLGFGLALAPVNAAVLASTADAVHGLASAMVVVARMVGMLIGISALTTIGLRRYYAEQADIPPIQDVCAAGTTRCAEYSDLLRTAGIAQEQTVFLGAAACALRGRGARPGAAARRRHTCCRSRPRRGGPGCPRSARLRFMAANDLTPPASTTSSRPTAPSPTPSTCAGFDGVAKAGVAIVTCMDSRIDPLGMLGLTAR